MTAFLQPTPLTETVRAMCRIQRNVRRILKPPLAGGSCHSAVAEQWLLFDQTFQIFILWRPIIPTDRMTDIIAAAPALQTDDLSRRTTPDTRPRKSATAGKDPPNHTKMHPRDT